MGQEISCCGTNSQDERPVPPTPLQPMGKPEPVLTDRFISDRETKLTWCLEHKVWKIQMEDGGVLMKSTHPQYTTVGSKRKCRYDLVDNSGDTIVRIESTQNGGENGQLMSDGAFVLYIGKAPIIAVSAKMTMFNLLKLQVQLSDRNRDKSAAKAYTWEFPTKLIGGTRFAFMTPAVMYKGNRSSGITQCAHQTEETSITIAPGVDMVFVCSLFFIFLQMQS